MSSAIPVAHIGGARSCLCLSAAARALRLSDPYRTAAAGLISSPKIYGDKLAAEITDKNGGPIEAIQTLIEVARRVAFILASGKQAKGEGEEGRTRH
jgi:hypothetical protein